MIIELDDLIRHSKLNSYWFVWSETSKETIGFKYKSEAIVEFNQDKNWTHIIYHGRSIEIERYEK